MLSAFRFYEMYCAACSHIKSNTYDYFKYNGKARVTEKSFMGRTDKYTFEKLAKKLFNEETATEFIFSNFMAGNTYIRNMTTESHTKFTTYKQSLLYKFKDEVKVLLDERKKSKDNELNLFFDNKLRLETFIILDYITTGKWSQKYKDNFIFEEIQEKMLTYGKFVVEYMNIETNKKQLTNILIEQLKE